MLQEVNLSQKLNWWREYTKGHKSIQKSDEQTVRIDALKDLIEIQETFQDQIDKGRVTMDSVLEICKLMDTIERIVQCISKSEDLYTLGVVSAFVRESVQNLHFDDFAPQVVINRLQHKIDFGDWGIEGDFYTLLPTSTSALESLIGPRGILHENVLKRALGMTSKEVIERCFMHAGLVSVENLIDLCTENKNESNILKIIKDHIEISQKEACAKMDEKVLKAFQTQWNKVIERDWIFKGKIKALSFNAEPERMDPWDFLKKTTLEKELENIPENDILKKTRLFKGEKGDLYLTIDNHNSIAESAKARLGDIFVKLNAFANYLWSPDGISFYFMKKSGYEDSGKGYTVTFDTGVGSDATVSMIVNEVYATLKEGNAKYEVEPLDRIKQLFASLKNGEVKFIPLPSARTPEYLFQMKNGQYVYVDSIYVDGYLFFEVCMGFKGHYKNMEVKNVVRYRDSGTIVIDLANGGEIFIPFGQPSTFTDSTGQIHPLESLETKGFDYKSIGIELGPINKRHTMLELYQ